MKPPSMARPVSVILALSCASPAMASQILPVSLPQVVKEAHHIVAGTVSRLEYAADSGTVFTRVTLRDLVIVKGAWSGDSMTFQVPGGVWKGSAVVLVGFPHFKIDGRYVLCLRAGLGTPQDHHHSIVFWDQGLFPVTEDPSGRKGVVHDCDYHPIVAIEEGNLVILGTRSDPYVPDYLPRESPEAARWRKERERKMRDLHREDSTRYVEAGYQTATARIVVPDAIDPGTRIDEPAFLSAVREILKR